MKFEKSFELIIVGLGTVTYPKKIIVGVGTFMQPRSKKRSWTNRLPRMLTSIDELYSYYFLID